MVEDSRITGASEKESTLKTSSERAIDLMFVSPAYEAAFLRQTQSNIPDEDAVEFVNGVMVVRASDNIQYRFHDRGDVREVMRFEGEPGYEFITDVTVGKGEFYIQTFDRRPTKDGGNEVRVEIPQEDAEEEILKFAGRYFKVPEDKPYEAKHSPEFQIACFAQRIIGDRYESKFGSRATTGIGKVDYGKWGVNLWVFEPLSDSDMENLSRGLGIKIDQAKNSIVVVYADIEDEMTESEGAHNLSTPDLP